MDIDKLIRDSMIGARILGFSSLMDIDKLILEMAGTDNMTGFSSLMDIDKLIPRIVGCSACPGFSSLMDIDKLILKPCYDSYAYGTYTDTTKTEGSKRSIKVPKRVIDLLKELHDDQKEKTALSADKSGLFVGGEGEFRSRRLPDLRPWQGRLFADLLFPMKRRRPRF